MCKVSTRPPVAHALHSGRRALFNPLWCQKPRLRRNSDQSATHVYAARVLAALPPRYHLLAHASTSLSRRYPHLLLSALSTSLRNPPSALSTYYHHSALSTSLRTIYLLPLSALSTSLRAIHLTGSLTPTLTPTLTLANHSDHPLHSAVANTAQASPPRLARKSQRDRCNLQPRAPRRDPWRRRRRCAQLPPSRRRRRRRQCNI